MKRYKHNLGHQHLLTCDMGQLVPIGCVEALPGDTFQHHVNVLARVSPLAAPVMHPVTARVHHFFVPTRLVWNENTGDAGTFEDFITGGPDGDNADTVPTIATTGIPGDLFDYFGMPRVAGINVNVLPIRAFNMIYNEYYRDQDLATELAQNNPAVPHIAWEKDYFTSARPWTQKGPDVTIPLGDKAPVQTDGLENSEVGVYSTDAAAYVDQIASTTNVTLSAGGSSELNALYANLANATGGNINDIRRAFAIQRYQEARARYGSRYTEYLRYLGVNPADSRLQRPEFLGGGKTQINFSEVLQTGQETGATTAEVGDMYGHGIAAMRSNKYRRFIEEHGFIISCFSVRPKAIYTNGIHRMWLRSDKEDYFQKELQHIGQQEVYNNEVYADNTATGMETFGYQDRYMEYREHPSFVSAEFRTLLNYWHMAREFTVAPALNQSFTDCVPTKRIHNEQLQHAMWIMAQHKMVARRMVDRKADGRIF